jgi:hypothetical protein
MDISLEFAIGQPSTPRSGIECHILATGDRSVKHFFGGLPVSSTWKNKTPTRFPRSRPEMRESVWQRLQDSILILPKSWRGKKSGQLAQV